ncbi:MAG: hypothetical protein V4553_05315 [Bacteroidota bacterium]
MINFIALALLLLTIVLSTGGGLYEILVIYPNWRHSKDAAELKERLQSSGQNYAGTRFWPLASPAQALLSIVNLVMAWRYDGPAHSLWLTAAIIIFVTRVITFSYFIPVMVTKIMQAEKVPAAQLPGIIKRWTALSPLRLITEFAALITGAWALLFLAVAAGIV